MKNTPYDFATEAHVPVSLPSLSEVMRAAESLVSPTRHEIVSVSPWRIVSAIARTFALRALVCSLIVVACLLFATPAEAKKSSPYDVMVAGKAGLSNMIVMSIHLKDKNKTALESDLEEIAVARQAKYDVEEAVDYLRKSPTASSIIDRIENSGKKIILLVNSACDDKERPLNETTTMIMWDSKCAHRGKWGSSSPTLALLHEMVHSLHFFDDPSVRYNNSFTKHKEYDNNEERVTILYGENPVACELGEAQRHNHYDGTEYRVWDVTTR